MYARGLYEALVESTLEDLRAAAPKLARVQGQLSEQHQQIQAVMPEATNPLLNHFLLALAQNNALSQLPSIVSAFEHYTQAEGRRMQAEVVSAVALDTSQQERIQRDLQQSYQKPLQVRFQVDEQIIGGLIIRVGDQVIDTSLRSRLNNVQRSMLTS